MKKYDIIVIGSGAGMHLASAAYERGMKVAVIEHGPMGGTCLNRGCIPTKILTYVADLIVQTEHANELNITAKVESVDFKGIMDRMRDNVRGSSQAQGEGVDAAEGLDWYKETGEFVGNYIIKVGNEEITAPNIFIVAGSRPLIPDIKGLDKVDYLTNISAMDMTEKPKSMIILGGGYLAVEFGHFFAAVGVDVTIVGRNPYLVKKEDNDVSELLKEELSKRMNIHTNIEAIEVSEKDGIKTVIAVDRETGEKHEFKAETILVATGRRSNADLFKPEKTGVKTDERGWVTVDQYFRTSKKGIWAFGDAIGKYQFRHVANDESETVWYNFVKTLEDGEEAELTSLSYHAVPWAIFSYPPVATVGMTLRDAQKSGRVLLVGQMPYANTAKGMAMGSPPGFVRVIADAETQEILGATIIGLYAPILIQEVINLMYSNVRSFIPMFKAMHIHPALPEVVQRAFGRLSPIGGHEHKH